MENYPDFKKIGARNTAVYSYTNVDYWFIFSFLQHFLKIGIYTQPAAFARAQSSRYTLEEQLVREIKCKYFALTAGR